MKKAVVVVFISLLSLGSLLAQNEEISKDDPVLFSDFLMGPYLFIEHIEYDAVMLFGYRFGYEANEKVIICNDYLVPKLENELSMEKGSIVIKEDIVKHIVEKYTKEEKGVRNLKRCLEIIYSKLNLYTMMKPGTTLFGEKTIEDIKFPFEVTEEVVEKVIQKGGDKNVSHMAMYL